LITSSARTRSAVGAVNAALVVLRFTISSPPVAAARQEDRSQSVEKPIARAILSQFVTSLLK
jgi:hypothetical protein